MSEERFERIERTLEQLAVSQAASDARITSLGDSIGLLVQVSGQHAQAITQLQDGQARLIEIATQTFARMDAMQSEIRGLQTENRRILDILLGEDDGDGDE